jgi:LCP family protein required for cell wall assembly
MSGTKKAFIAVGTLLLVLVVAVAAIGLGIRHSINTQIRHVPSAVPSTSTGPQSEQSGGDTEQMNFLVLGSDSRQSGGDPTDWEYGAQRSDVMMLIQITGDRTGVNVMSIPRDSWVPIPDHGTAKINAAFSYGGAPLTIQTVQQLTGVAIDHFAVVDFTSFQEITDELGGVTINTADGPQQMDGDQALKFVRERYSLPSGDFDRVRRQQAWIQAIMSRMFDKDVLTSPTQLSSLVSILLEHSAVDEDLDFDSLVSLGLSLRDLDSQGVRFMTAPYTGTGTSDDGQSIVLLDDARLAELMEAWRQDDVGDYLASHGGSVQTLESGPVY